MNMKFKRAAAACAAVMMAGTFFTACGDNASTGDTTTTAANSAETTAAANGASDDTQADTQLRATPRSPAQSRFFTTVPTVTRTAQWQSLPRASTLFILT